MRRHSGRLLIWGLLASSLAAPGTVGAAIASPMQDGAGDTANSSHPDMQPTLIGSPAEWFGPANYPAAALRANRQGRVVVAIKVDAHGVATSCAVEVSSGTTSLDDATCRNAMTHAAFNPATDKDGRAVKSVYRLPVRWVLPETRLTVVDVSKREPEDSLVEVEVKVDADGRAISCTPTAVRLITPVMTPCSQFLPGSQTPLRWKRNGHPVGARLISRTTLHVVADQ